jgi:DNA-binding NtrC family response regulator
VNEKSILFVDDEEDILYVYKVLLEDAGFTVDTAFDCNSAQKVLDQKSFEFIVCDVNMPHCSGLEFFEYAKVKAPDSVFVFLTGHAQGSPEFKEVEASGVPVLTKPIEIIDLINELFTASRKSRQTA